ncbi:MAG: large conductance mechanosensitive channel protein MscL [Clostridiales bacterium]|nr:large conductance mechanosensitive channel protein MscL [Clostridiales bacterium]
MKNFFGEFKKFITRGNVLDMAVGVIVGGAFTAIVNGLSNFVLKPIINWLLALIMGKGSLENIVTFLGDPAYVLDANGNPTQVIDMANSFYIDWGSLINAIINFFLIAFVLFTIVKVINKVKEDNQKMKDELKKKTLDKNERKELKAAGISLKDKEAIKAYFEEKKAQEQAKAEEEARLLEEQAKAERLANPTVEDLLKDIKKLLESK